VKAPVNVTFEIIRTSTICAGQQSGAITNFFKILIISGKIVMPTLYLHPETIGRGCKKFSLLMLNFNLITRRIFYEDSGANQVLIVFFIFMLSLVAALFFYRPCNTVS